MYDAFVYNNLYYLILEKADGNLREHITKSGYIGNETEVIGIAGQILSGLEHIHNKGIIHRDVISFSDHVELTILVTHRQYSL